MGLLENMLQSGSSSYRAQAPVSPQTPNAPSPQSQSIFSQIVNASKDAAQTAAMFIK